jgi:hypothetical protein
MRRKREVDWIKRNDEEKIYVLLSITRHLNLLHLNHTLFFLHLPYFVLSIFSTSDTVTFKNPRVINLLLFIKIIGS